MTESSRLVVSSRLSLPLTELRFQASRAGGPGGQHVNTSSTRVELWWDVATSPSLTAEQRATLLARLGTRLTEDGQLRLVSSASRSQLRNKDAALARLQELLKAALTPVKVRRKTRPPRAAKERRLTQKRQQSERKRDRRRPTRDD